MNLPSLRTLIDDIRLSHGDLGERGFRPYRLLRGCSPDIRYMECHYSALAPGKYPHDPHRHDEEEVLIVVAGEAELVVEDGAGTDEFRRIRATPGDFVYYPAQWAHTLTNPGAAPVTYLMFKWLTDDSPKKPTTSQVFVQGLRESTEPPQHERGYAAERLLEGRTRYLRKLHSHRTRMQPGAGYDAHADAYDVGIILYRGEIETLDQSVTAPAFIYYAAGELHGLRNVGDEVAEYIVFEFHGEHGTLYRDPREQRAARIYRLLRDPRRLPRALKRRVARWLRLS